MALRATLGCFNLGVLYERGEGALASGPAAQSHYKPGLAFLKDGRKADALLCVERIQTLSTVLGLTVPNAFLTDAMLKAVYPSIPR